MVLTLATTLLIATVADAPDPIQADRPNFTNSTGITPVGKYVVELGYRQTASSGTTLRDYGDSATVRYGMSGPFELRVGLPSHLTLNADGSTNGMGDASIGFKYLLCSKKNRSFGLYGTTTIPSSTNGFGEKNTQPELRGLASFTLNEKQGVDVDLVVGSPVENGHRYTRYAASAAFNQQLSKTMSSFYEVYGVFPAVYGGSNAAYGDLGITKQLTNDLQVDAFYGHGLSGQTGVGFFGAGVSFRF